jgi:antitoxin component YwqK of YwqJK toxin-antitoxin module
MFLLFCGAICFQSCVNTPASEIKYNGDKALYKQFDTKGNLVLEKEFRKVNGHLVSEGYAKRFYSNGVLKSLSFYKDDKKDSIDINYYPNGIVESRALFSTDTLAGHVYLFNSNGKPLKYLFYMSGKDPRFYH